VQPAPSVAACHGGAFQPSTRRLMLSVQPSLRIGMRLVGIAIMGLRANLRSKQHSRQMIMATYGGNNDSCRGAHVHPQCLYEQ